MKKTGKKGNFLDKVPFKLLFIILGGALYAIGTNLFVEPVHIFNGGSVGVAQVIARFVNIDGINVYAICYVLINVPLMVLAYKGVGGKFFVRTILGIASIAAFGLIIPVAAEPLVPELLTSAIIGGVLTGAGVGLILITGGCGGGLDIVGVYFMKKNPGFSVGKVTVAGNLILYLVVFLIYRDFTVVVYSVLVLFACAFAIDKVHYQNINMRVMVFTKVDGVDKELMKTGRGVTEWEGVGAYTQKDTHVLVTCINKYEGAEFEEIIHSIDPDAFIIIDENIKIYGNFEKRV